MPSETWGQIILHTYKFRVKRWEVEDVCKTMSVSKKFYHAFVCHAVPVLKEVQCDKLLLDWLHRLNSLQKLNVSYDRLGDEDLKSLHFLVKLDLSDCSSITGMLSLSLSHLLIRTDEALKHMPQLKYLLLNSNETIAGDVFNYLPQLEALSLANNTTIKDHHLLKLSHVRYLNLYNNKCITGKGITHLNLY